MNTTLQQRPIHHVLAIMLTGLLAGCLPTDEAAAGGAAQADSADLAAAVNTYRQQKGLAPIPVSPALTLVAQMHVKDLEQNSPAKGSCNLHSWSENGDWEGCCYTDDHANAQCMWDKPREITSYTGNGYEISAHYTGEMTPSFALSQWQSSSGHHNVILNQGQWQDNQWQAMGAAFSTHYAVVWFGQEPDASR